MPLPSVTFRSELPPVVRKELDQLDSELTEYLLQEHDDDGRHTHITASSLAITGGPITLNGVPVTPVAPSVDTFFYRADINSQAANDPGTGRMRWNTVDQHAATALYFDRLTTNDFDAMLFLLLSDLDDLLVVQAADLAVQYQVFTITGPAVNHADWFEVPVAFDGFNGPIGFSQLQGVALMVRSGGSASARVAPAGAPLGPVIELARVLDRLATVETRLAGLDDDVEALRLVVARLSQRGE